MSHKDPEKGPNHKMRGEHKGAEQSYNKCFGMSPESEGKDHPCIFPFIYRGIVSEFQLHLTEMLKNYLEICEFNFAYVANTILFPCIRASIKGRLWGYVILFVINVIFLKPVIMLVKP